MPGLNTAIYEFLNLTLAALSIFMALIFGRRVVRYYREGASSVLRVAAGLILVCIGSAILRGFTWLARYGDRMDWDVAWMERMPFGLTPIIGAATGIAGLLVCARALASGAWTYEITTLIVLICLLITFIR